MNHRPLSPHLQVYKPQITSILSILHRFTGVGLMVGLVVLMYFLWALTAGADTYQQTLTFFESFLGQLLLGGLLFSFYYHLANGIRHLAWDMGYGYSLKAVSYTGWAVIIAAVVLTTLHFI